MAMVCMHIVLFSKRIDPCQGRSQPLVLGNIGNDIVMTAMSNFAGIGFVGIRQSNWPFAGAKLILMVQNRVISRHITSVLLAGLFFNGCRLGRMSSNGRLPS